MATDANAALRGDLLTGTALSAIFPSTAVFEIRTGAPPGSANAASGTLLWTFTIASGWAAASGASQSLASVPLTANASGTGTAGYYRLKNAADTRRVEGTITVTGGGGDLTFDSVSFTSGQSFSLTGYTFNITN
jgi:hypothetical protein